LIQFYLLRTFIFIILQRSVLQTKLDKLALRIGTVGLVAGALCIVVLVLRFSITVCSLSSLPVTSPAQTFGVDDMPWESSYASDYVAFVVVGITVLVVAIPEGLPLAVTLALAYSVKKMLKDNNLVRFVYFLSIFQD
jgi:Ca2+ transporting ATPase